MLTDMQLRNLTLARQMRAPEHTVIDAGHNDGVRMCDFGRFGRFGEGEGEGEGEGDSGNGTARGTDNDTRSPLVECGSTLCPTQRPLN